jgi:hypothetical protein
MPTLHRNAFVPFESWALGVPWELEVGSWEFSVKAR